MLNKKAQVEDTTEVIISIIGIALGVALLMFAKADYERSIENAKESIQGGTTISAFDVQFMGTDLLNTLKLPIGEYTIGEVIAYIPRNNEEVQDPELFEGILWDKWFIDGVACDAELYTVINEHLSLIYEKYWSLKVVYEGEEIFTCHPSDILFGFGPAQTSMTVPTRDPEKYAQVILEVYQ